MKNTKLIDVLSTLSPAEFRKFEKYVRSPYFNTHDDTLKFFLAIKPFYPEFLERDLDANAIFDMIYEGEMFNDSKLRTLRKYLLKLLMGFMGQTALEADEWLTRRLQLQAFINKNLHKYILKMFTEFRNNLDSFQFENSEKFFQTYQLEDIEINYDHKYGSRWKTLDFDRIQRALDNFYLTEKLKYSCAILIKKQVFNTYGMDISMVDQILSFCEQNLSELSPITAAYYHAIQLIQFLNNGSSQNDLRESLHIDALNKILGKFRNKPEDEIHLDQDDLGNIYNTLLNYHFRQYKKGRINFLNKTFDLYRDMLARKLLFDNGMLSGNHYKNIATMGLRLGKFEWTEEFIYQYRERLDPDLEEAIFNYNLAHLFLYKKEFRQALKYLQGVEFLDPFYKLGYNMLLLKIYYECEDTEALLSLCTSFRTLLRRKQELAEHQKKPYMNFIGFTRALYLIKTQEKDNIDKVSEEIQDATHLIEKDWLLEKVKEIISVKVTK